MQHHQRSHGNHRKPGQLGRTCRCDHAGQPQRAAQPGRDHLDQRDRGGFQRHRQRRRQQRHDLWRQQRNCCRVRELFDPEQRHDLGRGRHVFGRGVSGGQRGQQDAGQCGDDPDHGHRQWCGDRDRGQRRDHDPQQRHDPVGGRPCPGCQPCERVHPADQFRHDDGNRGPGTGHRGHEPVRHDHQHRAHQPLGQPGRRRRPVRRQGRHGRRHRPWQRRQRHLPHLRHAGRDLRGGGRRHGGPRGVDRQLCPGTGQRDRATDPAWHRHGRHRQRVQQHPHRQRHGQPAVRGGGLDTLYGNAGNDSLRGDTADDQVYGGDGEDLLRGGAAADNLYGGEGDDTLWGDVAADRLFGDAGEDVLVGGAGRDTLYGGADADTFVFRGVADSAAGSSLRDIISGFEAGLDLIDLTRIDANAILNGNQAFTFIGTAAFGSVAGQLRAIHSASSVLQADVNGDGVADFELQLNGIATISVNDILL
ncbi:MAG: calcium-binding protein [Gemmobacter sp.]